MGGNPPAVCVLTSIRVALPSERGESCISVADAHRHKRRGRVVRIPHTFIKHQPEVFYKKN